MSDIEIYQVGGSVRDSILGRESKDLDFVVLAPSYEAMREHLLAQGFEIFLETPAYYTIRGRFPADAPFPRQAADFVWARKDGPYSDGRHPDWVKPGTLHDDLSRRDFTMNAIARSLGGQAWIDPFGGVIDINRKRIACVGSAQERFSEDALRALRAIRFHITLGFELSLDIRQELWSSSWLPELLSYVSVDRRRQELLRSFRKDNLATMNFISSLPKVTQEAIFSGGLWLEPTNKE